MAKITLTLEEKDVQLLIKLRNLLDELIELVEVETDEEALAGVDEGLEDIREGRVRPLKEFLKELGETGS